MFDVDMIADKWEADIARLKVGKFVDLSAWEVLTTIEQLIAEVRRLRQLAEPERCVWTRVCVAWTGSTYYRNPHTDIANAAGSLDQWDFCPYCGCPIERKE